MGTLFTITLYAEGETEARAAAESAFQRISELEEIMSDYQADSELMQLVAHSAGESVRVSPDLFAILSESQRISAHTDGAFDVTVGPFVRLWRFSRKRGVLPKPEEIAAVRPAVGWNNLELNPIKRTVTMLRPGMRLDLGGIAKGYAADQALALLKSRGYPRALVAASGDIAIGDPPPGANAWRISITGMEAGQEHSGPTLLLRNAGVSTSGDTEQFIEIGGMRYSHILDPSTGLGLTRRIQATVVAPRATLSDALATSVCILGPARGREVLRSYPHTTTRILTRSEDGMTREDVSAEWNRLLSKSPTEEKP